MSRTIRNIEGKEYDDTQARFHRSNDELHKKKMAPYTRKQPWFCVKEETHKGDGYNKSRELVNNVNRSYKKGRRQELKNELRKEFAEYQEQNELS